jgi:hypothetical protein
VTFLARSRSSHIFPVYRSLSYSCSRPDREGDLSKLDFVKSVDTIYKEMRLLRASIASSSRVDKAFEAIVNTFFYVSCQRFDEILTNCLLTRMLLLFLSGRCRMCRSQQSRRRSLCSICFSERFYSWFRFCKYTGGPFDVFRHVVSLLLLYLTRPVMGPGLDDRCCLFEGV